MPGFNFADNYKSAGLTTSGETIRLRHEAFEAVRKSLDSARTLDLCRLYFGLPVPRGTDWFRDAFAATDPSFSMVENEREAAVLAVGLLDVETQAGNDFAGLAVLCAAFAGVRTPKVRPMFVGEVLATLRRRQVAARQRTLQDVAVIKNPAPGKAGTDAATLPQANDWSKVATLFKQVGDEATAATKTLAGQVVGVIKPLLGEISDLREETEMLWWHVGGWSSSLDRPLSGMDVATAAVVAGIDLAALTKSSLGPIASAALLLRTIQQGRATGGEKVSLQAAVDSLGLEELEKLNPNSLPKEMHDICPVRAALSKAAEAGMGTTWHSQFEKATGLAPTSPLSPHELAMQAYRENLLAALAE